MKLRTIAATFMAASALFSSHAAEPAGIPEGYTLRYQQDFKNSDSLGEFTFTDPSAWRWVESDGKAAMELQKQSAYKPPVRSPVNIALITGMQFGDFVLEAQCMQTGKEYGHRDMIFVFGYQDPSRFYYTHIATKADDHANQIFIVNEKPRTKISQTSNTGNQWGLNVWRKVRIERTGATIRVFFDDMSKPVMTAEDPTFAEGWVGFGSFDDTGKVANIRIWSKTSTDKKVPAFPTVK
jgi:hypothetical protein